MTDRFDELERLIDSRLQQTPAPRAPETLAPRIMRAVRAAEPAPATPGWSGWPLAWQASSLAALVVLTFGVIQLWPVITGLADAPIFTAGRVIWRVVVEPVGLFLAV